MLCEDGVIIKVLRVKRPVDESYRAILLSEPIGPLLGLEVIDQQLL